MAFPAEADRPVTMILLADDSTHAQRMGTKILSAEGYQVNTVSNGKAAIDSLKKAVPDLVIADVFMPGRNGYEVCQHVKTSEEFKHIPVLLIIGAMEPYDPDEGKRAGADGVLTKPLESSNLVATVKGLLEAAKHFAPAKPQPKKEKQKGETVTAAPDPTYAPVVEDPAWNQEEEIITTNPRQDEMVIPHAISQQPVGMLTDLLEPADAPVAPPAAPAELAPELMMEALPAPVAPAEEIPLPEIPVAVPEIPSLAAVLPLEPAPEETRAKSSLPSWVAREAEVTAEDEKLFEPPPAATPSWTELTQMAAAVAEEPAAITALPWQTEPDLIRPDTEVVPAGTAEGIEHFENLNETISSYAPIPLAALGIGIEPIPLETAPESTESAPIAGSEMILSPADVAAGTAPETVHTGSDPNLDRGYEPITATVALPLPEPEPAAPVETVETVVEVAVPAIETAAPVEEVSVVEATALGTPEIAAEVAATLPEATAEIAAELPAELPAVPQADPLVEAAVAMVKEATERELAADAAAAPQSAQPPAVDPATLEHVIRGVVGELMPQIVAQVKSALKH